MGKELPEMGPDDFPALFHAIDGGLPGKALVRSENWRAIIQDLVLAGRAADAKALAGNLTDPWHKSFLEEYTAVAEVATNARTNPSHDASLAPILRLVYRWGGEPDLQRMKLARTSYGDEDFLPQGQSTSA